MKLLFYCENILLKKYKNIFLNKRLLMKRFDES
jgi:hypothetical protein